MDVKEAVQTAKEYIVSVFGSKKISHVGLQGVEFVGDRWEVTIGFSRPWDYDLSPLTSIVNQTPRRSYKVISIDDYDGRVISVKNHPVTALV